MVRQFNDVADGNCKNNTFFDSSQFLRILFQKILFEKEYIVLKIYNTVPKSYSIKTSLFPIFVS